MKYCRCGDFWMWTVLIIILLVGWVIDKLDMREKTDLTFSMKEMPNLRPIVIETKGKGFWNQCFTGFYLLEIGK